MAYALPGVSRARSMARTFRKSRSIAVVSGCALPSTRREIRSASSSVVTASRTSLSVAQLPSVVIYAETLYLNPGAKLDDLSEAVTTLEDAERIARRVLGGAHPVTRGIEHHLRNSRAVLRAREAQSS